MKKGYYLKKYISYVRNLSLKDFNSEKDVSLCPL